MLPVSARVPNLFYAWTTSDYCPGGTWSEAVTLPEMRWRRVATVNLFVLPYAAKAFS